MGPAPTRPRSACRADRSSRPVLGRVVGMLTARADCPIDRLDDALLVADAIAAKAGSFSDDGRINVRVAVAAGSVELEVGPLRPAAPTASSHRPRCRASETCSSR